MHRSLALCVGLALALGACSKKPVPPPPTEPKIMPPEPGAAPLTCSIHVTAPLPMKILLDGKPACETTPCELENLAPGNHDVTCIDPEAGPGTSGVSLEPGQHIETVCPTQAIRHN